MNDKYERNLFQHSTGFYHKFYDFHHRKFTGNCLDVAAMATQIFLSVHKKMPQLEELLGFCITEEVIEKDWIQ